MDIVLKVTPEKLIEAANNIQQQIQSVSDAFQVIETEIKKSKSYWEGDASSLHQTNYSQIKDDIQAVLKTLRNRPENLLEMAGLYSEAEKENVGIVESLSNSLIS